MSEDLFSIIDNETLWLLQESELLENGSVSSSDFDEETLLASSGDAFQAKRKKSKNSPDANAINEDTYKEVVDQGIDPRSKDGKLKKRQIRNRISAQYHRERKNKLFNEMEETICDLRNENARLVRENEDLRKLSGNTGCASVDPSVPLGHIFYSAAYPHYANNSISCSESCSWNSNGVYLRTDTEEQEKDLTEDFIHCMQQQEQQHEQQLQLQH